MARPIIGNEDKRTAKIMSCVIKLMRTQNVPMTKNTVIKSLFLPINLTVLLTATPITAQLTFATELILYVIGSMLSMHGAPSSMV